MSIQSIFTDYCIFREILAKIWKSSYFQQNSVKSSIDLFILFVLIIE